MQFSAIDIYLMWQQPNVLQGSNGFHYRVVNIPGSVFECYRYSKYKQIENVGC